jgi:hypothetical protein
MTTNYKRRNSTIKLFSREWKKIDTRFIPITSLLKSYKILIYQWKMLQLKTKKFKDMMLQLKTKKFKDINHHSHHFIT